MLSCPLANELPMLWRTETQAMLSGEWDMGFTTPIRTIDEPVRSHAAEQLLDGAADCRARADDDRAVRQSGTVHHTKIFMLARRMPGTQRLT